MKCLCLLFLLIGSACSSRSKTGNNNAKPSDQGKFNELVLNELKQLKTFQIHAEDKFSDLEKQNREKDLKIEALEREISALSQFNQISEKNAGYHRQERAVDHYAAFTAFLTQPIVGITRSQTIKFDRVLLNDGNGYNPTTGEFTAPVSGVYLFSFSIGAKNVSGVVQPQYDVFADLVINGVRQVSATAESGASNEDSQGSSTAILYALEGDTVSVLMENRGGNALYSTDNERIASFAGTLLYQRQSDVIIG